MNLLDILSTSPTTSVGNEKGQQMRIQILSLKFKRLSSSSRKGDSCEREAVSKI